jgi:arylsulfatase
VKISSIASTESLIILAVALSSQPDMAPQTTGTPGSPEATTTVDGRYLPSPPDQFKGDIQLNALQSKPYWPPMSC